MSNITVFTFDAKHHVRTIEHAGGVLFVARDVALALGYSDSAGAVTKHCKHAKSLISLGSPIQRPYTDQSVTLDPQTKLIPESDVFRLVMRSKLEGAERFQDWVCEEVLPTIRKTGSYSIPKEPKDTSALDARRRALALKDAMDSADRLAAKFPNLSGISQQEVFSRLINAVMGAPLLPQPEIEKVYSATEVGGMFSPPIPRNTIGRKANELNLKTPEFGKYVLGAAENVDKQVPQFLYNEKGVEKLKSAFRSEELMEEYLRPHLQ